MRQPNVLPLVALPLLIAVLAVSCTPTPGHPTISKEPPVTTADCGWVRQAYAWLDDNENGIPDEGEQPLSSVPVFVDDTLHGFSHVNDYVMTNLQGEARLQVWLPGCPDYDFVVYPAVPAGYRLTTPARITVTEPLSEEPFSFGFTYLPGVPTITPRPNVSLACIPYPLPDGLFCVQHLLVDPNGIVWGADNWGGIFRYDPQDQTWTVYTEEDGLPSTGVASIFRAPDGTLWAATYNGVASFDGNSWITRRARDGFNSTVHDKAVYVLNGEIWVVTDNGVDRFDPTFQEMARYPLEGGRDIFIGYATQSPDGTIWGIRGPSMGEPLFELRPTSNPQWTIRNVPPKYSYYVIGIDTMSTGAVCLAGMAGHTSGVACFDPKTERWFGADNESTNGALVGESFYSFAIAPDDSIWLGTWQNGVIQLKLTPEDPAAIPQVIYLTEDELMTKEGNGITAIAFAPDDAIWFGDQESIIRCIRK